MDGFNEHAFQNTWKELVGLLKTSTVDDKTVTTSVEELARLKKATAYIDQLLRSLDPELVPPQIWDSFLEQSQLCLNQLRDFENNRSLGHLRRANAHIDNLLTYVRPYQVVTGRVAKSLKEAASAYSEAMRLQLEKFSSGVAESVAEIDRLAVQAGEKARLIGEAGDAVVATSKEVAGDGASPGLHAKFLDALRDMEEKHQGISTLHSELLVDSSDRKSTKSVISEFADLIAAKSLRASERTGEIERQVAELGDFYIRIFGQAEGESEEKGGLSKELDEQLERLAKSEREHNRRYAAWNEEIRGLLPSATSAGLAHAYATLKNSFERPIKVASGVFYGAVGLLIASSLILLVEKADFTQGFYVEFIAARDWLGALKAFVQRLPFYAPVVWLAYYASKRRSEFQRLQQEYAHKEAIASSYESFKRQVSELGEQGGELSKMLLATAIEAISKNASSTLDGSHGDKFPIQEIIERAAMEAANRVRP